MSDKVSVTKDMCFLPQIFDAVHLPKRFSTKFPRAGDLLPNHRSGSEKPGNESIALRNGSNW